ncbi:hypothetical protein LOY64_04285 [Pseudomonas corrugata]|uniref:hypothetical protein n=1 Tax=Pseudomonas corrugata TaxID=47879 RepID=UPI00222F058E|nr:hypothetical protein [Pseudomonas corrugata]UZD96231.1 hypothetical protein LOY64_04285 [Pseudomonas corrugata]
MSRFTFCNCPAGFSADPERHAPDCPGRFGAGKSPTPVPATYKPSELERVTAERDALQQQQARRRAATIEALKPENQRIVPCNETPPTDYFKCMKGE